MCGFRASSRTRLTCKHASVGMEGWAPLKSAALVLVTKSWSGLLGAPRPRRHLPHLGGEQGSRGLASYRNDGSSLGETIPYLHISPTLQMRSAFA